LVRRIEKQNVELQVADVAKDEFVSTVSHELRTPLTSIRGFVELMLDESGDPLTEQQRGFLATVQRGSNRLERLVNDLLLTAQLQAGHLDIQKTHEDLVKIVRESVESAQAQASIKELQLNLVSLSASIEVEADGVRLAQAVDNVISNAIKFTPEGGRVQVELTQDGDRVSLTVTDTGMGMTAADVERLFEPFFRTDSAGEIQGTGLGLPIVKAIIEAHDGLISVTSKPEVGTSLVISLPLAEPFERQALSGPHAAAPTGLTGDKARRSRSALVGADRGRASALDSRASFGALPPIDGSKDPSREPVGDEDPPVLATSSIAP
jgi:signal transduction histidine kinase